MPKVYAIVLNHNSAATLPACLDSIFHSRNVDFHVVVVDNASIDDSFETARKQFTKAEYIHNAQNIGFAAGNNVGIRFALERNADYVVLINSDATIDPDMLYTLMSIAEEAATPLILCPYITTPSGKTWYAGARISWLKMRTMHTPATAHGDMPFSPTDVATGCVMSISKDVFKKIGLLNESYFLYYEDADFSFCAKRAKITVAVTPQAHAVHHEVSEQKQNKLLKTYWLVLSALLFFSAHAPLPYKALYKLLIPLRRLKNYFTPSDKNLAPHVRRAFIDFPKAKKYYVRHY